MSSDINFKEPNNCQYPDCGSEATTHWALVPLCEDHRETISLETQAYYQKSSVRGKKVAAEEDRIHYANISHLIPWSKERLGKLEGVR